MRTHWSGSRRRFVTGAGAFAVAVGGAVIAGCGGKKQEQTAAQAGGQPGAGAGPAEPPVAGGTLRYSTGNAPRTLNPFNEVSANTAWIIMPCYNGLLKPDPLNRGETLIPDLATKWEQVDPTTVSFTLPQGAVFHEDGNLGRGLRAQDVVASLTRVITPGSRRATPRTGLITAVERIEAPDESRVTFKLKRPSASLLRLLAVGWFVVAPEEVVGNESHLDTHIVGTGPFMLKQYDPRRGATLAKNPRYFRPDRPYLDGIEIAIIADTSTRVSSFATGQQDIYLDGLNKSQRQLLAGKSDIEFDAPQDPTAGPDYHLCVRTPPYTDVRVRQAINAAINREETYVVNLPTCPMLFKSPMGLSKWALSQDELVRRQGNRIGAEKQKDIQEAKALLEAAGMGSGFKTEILIGESVVLGTALGPDAVGLVVAQQLSAIGVQAEVVKLDYTRFQERIFSFKYEQASYAISFPAPDPTGLGLIFSTNAGRNYSGISDPEIDRLVQQQESLLDEGERMRAVQDLQRKILDTYSALYLTQTQPCEGTVPRRTHVKNWKRDWDAARYDGMRMEEVWLAKGR
jgi:peptide/nickel transport system substrate-binding protein